MWCQFFQPCYPDCYRQHTLEVTSDSINEVYMIACPDDGVETFTIAWNNHCYYSCCFNILKVYQLLISLTVNFKSFCSKPRTSC